MGVTFIIGIATPAIAHHSFAMFDSDKTATLKGTVSEFEWTNPHAWLRLMAENPGTGKAVQWAFEMSSPETMGKVGLTPKLLKPGDTVTVSYHPLKDGTRGGQFIFLVMPDGKIAGCRSRTGSETVASTGC